MARSSSLTIVVLLALCGSALVAGGNAPTPAPVGIERILGGPAYEPVLTITPQGNIFYTGGAPQNDASAFPGSGWIWGSYDNGATWINTTEHSAGAAPLYDNYLAHDPATGRITRTALQTLSVGGNGCLDITTSDDQGATWTDSPMVCAMTPPFHDHESLAFGKPRGPLVPSGYPSLVHLCLNHAQGTECAVSLDGGASYLQPILVFPSVDPVHGKDAWCGGLNSPVQTDSEGRVFVPRLWCNTPEVAESDDGGLTWTTHVLPGPLASRQKLLGTGLDVEPDYIDLNVMHLAIDAADGLHVVYVAADGMPDYLASRDHGATWTTPIRVDAPGITGVAPSLVSLAAGAPGSVAIAYLSTDQPGGLGAPDWSTATWNMMLGVSTDTFGGAPFQWTQINAAGDPMGVRDCGLNRCTADEPNEELPGMYDYISVAIAPDGRPWVSMVDVCNAQCDITHVADEAVAAVGTLASGPSLATPGAALAPLGWS